MRNSLAQERARSLRTNSTDAERRLWHHLRARRIAGAKFRRQVPVNHYIVDFASFEYRIIVEVDGGQHDEQRSYDQQRDSELMQLGFHVLRFWNNEVLCQTAAVVEQIWRVISDIRAARG